MAEGENTIGSLGVRIFANIKPFNMNLVNARKAITRFVDHFNKEMKRVDSKALAQAATIAKQYGQRIQEGIQKGAGRQPQGIDGQTFGQDFGAAARFANQKDKAWKKVNKSFGTAMHQVRTGAEGYYVTMGKMTTATQNAARHSIRAMLNFKAFFSKIIHYVTFSIGVQMVMMARQGIQNLIDTFKEFERSIVNAATVSGYLGGAAETVKQRLMDLSKSLSGQTLYSIIEISDAMYSLASAGYDVAKVTEKQLLPILDYAAATQTDLKEATQAVMATMKQFHMDLDNTTKIVDVYTTAITSSFMTMEKMSEAMKYAGPIAGTLGVKFEETTAAVTALANQGMEGSQAGQRLNMIFTKLLKPTDKAKRTLEEMGVEVKDLNPETKSLVEILYTLQAAGFGAAEAATMFRARTAGAAATLVDNADDVAYMVKQYEMADSITHDVAQAQQQTLYGTLKMLGDEFTSVAATIGEKMVPAIRVLADMVKNIAGPALKLMGSAFGWINENAELFKNIMRISGILLTAYIIKTKLIIKLELLWASIKKLLIGMNASQSASVIVLSASTGAYTGVLWGMTAAAVSAAIAMKALTVAFLTSPFGIALMAVTAIVAVVMVLTHKEEELTEEQKKLNSQMSEFQKICDDNTDALSDNNQMRHVWATLMQDNRAGAKKFGDEIKALGDILEKTPEEMKDWYWGDTFLNDAENVKKFKEFLETEWAFGGINEMREMIEATASLTESLDFYEVALYKLEEAIDDVTSAEEELTRVGRDNAEAQKIYLEAIEKMEEAERSYFRAVGGVLKALRQIPGNLDLYIQALEDASASETKRIGKLRALERLQREVGYSTEFLSKVMATHGQNSNEVADAEESLREKIEATINVEEELRDLEDTIGVSANIITAALNDRWLTIEELSESTDDYIKVEKELSGVESDLLGMAKLMIEARDDFIRLSGEEGMLQAKKNIMLGIQEDRTKYLNEALRKLYETENKIYDIRYKLYKLDSDRDDQLKDMFDTLAGQGLIDKEMIGTYKDMEHARGGLLKLNKKFIDVYGELSDEEKELVDAYMAGEDVDISDVMGSSVISQYRDAQDAFREATDAMSGSMIPVMQDLLNMGAVTSETAKQFYDYIDNAYEMLVGNLNLADSIDLVGESFEDALHAISQIAFSLVDGKEGTETLADAFDELTDTLEISDIFTDADESLDIINKLFGEQYETLEDVSAQHLMLAAALVKVSSDAGIYADGMDASEIATAMNIVSTDDFAEVLNILSSMANSATAGMMTLADIEAELLRVTEELITASDTLKQSVIDLAEYVDIDISDNFINGLSIEFHDAGEAADILYEKIENIYELIMDSPKEWALSQHLKDLPSALSGGLQGMRDWTKEWKNIKNAETFGDLFSGFPQIKLSDEEGEDYVDGKPKGRAPTGDEAMAAILKAIPGGNLLIDLFKEGKKFFDGFGLGGGLATSGTEVVTESVSAVNESLSAVASQVISDETERANMARTSLMTRLQQMGLGSTLLYQKLLDAGVTAKSSLETGSDSAETNLIGAGDSVRLSVSASAILFAKKFNSLKWPSYKSSSGRSTGGGTTSETISSIAEPIADIIRTSIPSWKWMEKVGGHQRGGIYNQSTLGVFGERGAEALIPLEGKNKKFGRKMLETIIPEFYPNLSHQQGGLYNYSAPNVSGGDTDVYQDNFNIYGPIELPGVSNGEAFAVELKRQFRASPGGN